MLKIGHCLGLFIRKMPNSFNNYLDYFSIRGGIDKYLYLLLLVRSGYNRMNFIVTVLGGSCLFLISTMRR